MGRAVGQDRGQERRPLTRPGRDARHGEQDGDEGGQEVQQADGDPRPAPPEQLGELDPDHP